MDVEVEVLSIGCHHRGPCSRPVHRSRRHLNSDLPPILLQNVELALLALNIHRHDHLVAHRCARWSLADAIRTDCVARLVEDRIGERDVVDLGLDVRVEKIASDRCQDARGGHGVAVVDGLDDAVAIDGMGHRLLDADVE